MQKIPLAEQIRPKRQQDSLPNHIVLSLLFFKMLQITVEKIRLEVNQKKLWKGKYNY